MSDEPERNSTVTKHENAKKKDTRCTRKREREFRVAYLRWFPEDVTFENVSFAGTTSGRVREPVITVCDVAPRPAKKAKTSVGTTDETDGNDDSDNIEIVDEEDYERNETAELEERGGERNETKICTREDSDAMERMFEDDEEQDAVEEEPEEEEEDDDRNGEGSEEEEEEQGENEEMVEDEVNEHGNVNNVFTFSNMKLMSQQLILKTNTTTVDVIVPIIANAVRSNSTYQSLVRSLKIEASKYVGGGGIPKKIDGFWKLMSRNDEDTMKRYYYCEVCNCMMGNNAKTLIDCNCGKYKPRQEKKSWVPYFIQVQLAPQLRHVLQTPTMFNSLQYPRTRTKRNANNMEDMYDGEMYREMLNTEQDFLSNVHNLSVTINTDGCSVANSSNASAWPILFQINELPPHLRKRHILLGGIWVSDIHPDLNAFLGPTISELQRLHDDGVVWRDPTDGNEKVTKIVTCICSVDTPARADILNMTRFNGKHGCTFCYAEGKSKQDTPGQRVYLVNDNVQLRDNESMRNEMMQACWSAPGTRINGIKGPSVMATLPKFDLASGIIVESMHNVYLGVAKLHTMLLFNGKVTDEWYCGSPSTVSAVDAELMKIQRPSKIARATRSLRKMKQWKANEWRNWILYYAVVCVQGNIDNNHVRHLSMLSRAAYIYNMESISVDELKEARLLIKEYVQKFQEIFGEENMRYNVHLLTHLPDTVENWGPMWAHSAFPFESWNKKIIERVTSANGRCLQIVARQMMYTFIESLLYEPSIKESTKDIIASTLYDGTKKGRNHGRHRNDDEYKFTTNGKSTVRAPNCWESEALRTAGINNVESVVNFRSVRVRGVNYQRHDEESTITKRYCDVYIHCDLGFAKIIDIVECYNHDNNVIAYGFFLCLMKSMSNVYEAKHIHHVKLSTERRFFRIVNEAPPPKPAVLITINFLEYAIALCNVWESD